jgi:hypothetical protein
MKHLKIASIALLLSLLVAGCGINFDLTVVNGSGTGSYTPYDKVEIVANDAPYGKTFDSWEGDISGIDDKYNPTTFITMNQRDKTIEATYIDVPIVPDQPEPPIVTNPPPVITNTPPVITNTPPLVYNYIAGDDRDSGQEVWIGNYQGMDVRLSANDVTNLRNNGIPAEGTWYSLDRAVIGSHVSLTVASDGGIIVTASDFTSGRTGKKYHYCGVTEQYSDSELLTDNPHHVLKINCQHTLRILWATYE